MTGRHSAHSIAAAPQEQTRSRAFVGFSLNTVQICPRPTALPRVVRSMSKTVEPECDEPAIKMSFRAGDGMRLLRALPDPIFKREGRSGLAVERSSCGIEHHIGAGQVADASPGPKLLPVAFHDCFDGSRIEGAAFR